MKKTPVSSRAFAAKTKNYLPAMTNECEFRFMVRDKLECDIYSDAE